MRRLWGSGEGHQRGLILTRGGNATRSQDPGGPYSGSILASVTIFAHLLSPERRTLSTLPESLRQARCRRLQLGERPCRRAHRAMAALSRRTIGLRRLRRNECRKPGGELVARDPSSSIVGRSGASGDRAALDTREALHLAGADLRQRGRDVGEQQRNLPAEQVARPPAGCSCRARAACRTRRGS